MSVKACQSLTT